MKMNCEKVRASLDSLIDGEVQDESSVGLNHHIRSCRECSEEAEARRAIRGRLQSAMRQQPVPEGLQARVAQRLREAETPHTRTKPFYLMAFAAAVALFAYRLAAPGNSALAAVMQIGVGDHIHCAVSRTGLNTWSPVEKLPAAFQPMLPAIRSQVPHDYRLALAHECSFRSRQFVHLIFERGGNRLSLVIARKRDGESLAREGVVTAVSPEGFQVAAFERRGFLVYAISDLPPAENAGFLAAVAPTLSRFLDQMGA